MGQKNSASHAEQNESSFLRLLSSSVIGGLSGAMISIILMLLCSFIAVSRENPDGAIAVFSIIISAVSYFFSGALSYKLSRRAPLICALICSPVMMIFLKFFSFICKSEADSLATPLKLTLLVSYIILSLAGALISSNLSYSSKKSKKKKR